MSNDIWFTKGFAVGIIGNSTTAFNGALDDYHPTDAVKVMSVRVDNDPNVLQIKILEGDGGAIKRIMEPLTFKKSENNYGKECFVADGSSAAPIIINEGPKSFSYQLTRAVIEITQNYVDEKGERRVQFTDYLHWERSSSDGDKSPIGYGVTSWPWPERD